ncbi:MAG: cupin domain-containing protein [Trueperaceae bacterium]|jgi:quercetin dioxygenase-like cupin family protein|nr:cupin domain-containing protein [Truepera sp.]HRN19253.1 cupin domain-containing protein [Trueperaceae bacterium]HRQ10242.1 cupin domain-containing protein [Trueperaceae bacterium]
MPLFKTSEVARFSERGPVPRPLNVGEHMAVMLLCLQKHQQIVAPESDGAETIFTVLEGSGTITEDDRVYEVAAGDIVHVKPGSQKSLEAGEGTFTVVGVRQLGGKHGA